MACLKRDKKMHVCVCVCLRMKEQEPQALEKRHLLQELAVAKPIQATITRAE